jgi:hypothetical protein
MMRNPLDLDVDDPLRNTPLGELKAEMRNIHGKHWRRVKGWVISQYTFNQLGKPWTNLNEWRIEDDKSAEK